MSERESLFSFIRRVLCRHDFGRFTAANEVDFICFKCGKREIR